MTGLELLRQECAEKMNDVACEILSGITDNAFYMRMCGQHDVLSTMLRRIDDITGEENND